KESAECKPRVPGSGKKSVKMLSSEWDPSQGGKKAPGNRPQFDLRSELYRISGVDLTRIDSIHVLVAQLVLDPAHQQAVTDAGKRTAADCGRGVRPFPAWAFAFHGCRVARP